MAKSGDQSIYFQSHILPVYKRAMVWDDNLGVVMQCLAGSIYHFADMRLKRKLHVVGSCFEGGCSPRMYQIPPVCEVDVLKLLDAVEPDYYGYPHPNKVGVYVASGVSRRFGYHRTGMVLRVPPLANSPQFMKEAHIRYGEQMKRNPQYYPQWRSKLSDTHQATLFGKGPAMKMNYSLYGTRFQVDVVGGRHHQSWPQEAEEWKTRHRLWPPQALKEKILQQGYQMLYKWTDSEDDMDHPFESHVTFALCEKLLGKQRTPVQRLVYLTAKTLFYSYLDLHDDNNPNIEFSSYALKTCMMYLMEQTPMDRWTEDNVWHMLRAVLVRLQNGVKHGYLENYFMDSVNVLSNCTPALLEKVNRNICCILSDMNRYLQGTKLYESNLLLYGYYLLQGLEEDYKDLVQECQNEVLEAVLQSLNCIHRVRATFKHITDILKQGTGKGLKSSKYQFDEEQCFHLLKTLLSIYSSDYVMNRDDVIDLMTSVHINFDTYMWDADDLIKKVLSLNQHLPKPLVVVMRLHCSWLGNSLQDFKIVYVCGNQSAFTRQEYEEKLIEHLSMLDSGETDIIIVFQAQNVEVCAFSSVGDLVDRYLRELHDYEMDKWMPEIYSLTHRDIPELQLMDFARMLYLMFDSPEVQMTYK